VINTASSQNRVVVFRTGHLGDTVCAIPAFRLLRQHFHNADLTLLCDRPDSQKVAAWDVIERLELFDRVISYRSGQGWHTLRELYHSVRRLAPDILVQLPQVDRTPRDAAQQRWFFRLAGVRHLIGFKPWIWNQEWHPDEPHRLVQLLNDAGIAGEKPPYAIPLDQTQLAGLQGKLAGLGLDLEQPYVVFCGGGKSASQRWPLARYAQVLKYVSDRFDIPIVGIGGPSDLQEYDQQLKPAFNRFLMPHAPLTISELAELLRFSTLYLGNDTGPMHLAAAVDCPVATVMSARNKPGRWDPDVQPRLILRHRLQCEGCRLNECIKEAHRCMTAITPDLVQEQLTSFLGNLLAHPRSIL
jgi:heptosyltransferase-3